MQGSKLILCPASFRGLLGSTSRLCQGDKVVKMNIDGVDASIEGIVQVDIPAAWASLDVGSEVGELAWRAWVLNSQLEGLFLTGNALALLCFARP